MKSTFSVADKKEKFMSAVSWIILYLFTTLFVYLEPLCKHNMLAFGGQLVQNSLCQVFSNQWKKSHSIFQMARAEPQSGNQISCDATKGCWDVTVGRWFPHVRSLSSGRGQRPKGTTMNQLQREGVNRGLNTCPCRLKIDLKHRLKNTFKGKLVVMSWRGPPLEQSVSTTQLCCKYEEIVTKRQIVSNKFHETGAPNISCCSFTA